MIKFDTETIKTINLFERLTQLRVRDCINAEDGVCFVVSPEAGGHAFNAKGVQELRRRMKRNIKIFEWNEDMKKFVKNMIPYSKKIEVESVDGKKTVTVRVGEEKRGIVIGKDGKNIKLIRDLLSRHHGIENVRLMTE